MKKFTSEQFDKFIRNQLYDYEQEPPAEIYHSLKKNMSASNGIQLWHFLSIGIIGIIVFVATFYFLPNNHQTTANQTSLAESSQTNLKPSETFVNSIQQENRSHKIEKNTSIVYTLPTKIHKVSNDFKSSSTTELPLQKTSQDDNYTQTTYEKPVYEIFTRASTCKQWNGKASIHCNISGINFYWKELNISKPTVENIKYGQYTVFAKRGDEIIDTLLVNIPDSGTVKADFNLYDMLVGNELITISENLSVVEKMSWKQQKNVTFKWYFGDEAVYNQPEPQHSFSKSGQYLISLVIKSSHGCKDSITKSYIVEIPMNYVEMPNIFSPNGDGIHDYFSPVLYDMESVECTIFDRNGTFIYEWKTLDGRWDGKIRNTNQLAPPATYYYILKGKTKNGKQILHKGMVQLVM